MQGQRQLFGTIGFVPQNAFVYSATLRENIQMASQHPINEQDPELMRSSCLLSSFQEDLLQMPDGLDTETGESGITLSGGQKTRLNLARALYRDPNLLVLDDPLAAVDARVGEHIFSSLKEWTLDHDNRSVVLALNQLHLAQRLDEVWVMKDGVLVESGTYEDLVDKKGEFAHLIQASGEAHMHQTSMRHLGQEELLTIHKGVAKEEAEDVDMEKMHKELLHNKLVEEEDRESGMIPLSVITTYLGGMGRGWLFLSMMAGFITYALMALNDRWLAFWLERIPNQSPTTDYFVMIYAIGTVLFLVFLQLTSWSFSKAGINASVFLHHSCVDTLLHGKMDWFEKNSNGRIMSRLVSDMGSVDQALSRFLDNFVQFTFTLLALVVVTIALVPVSSVVIVISMAAFFSLINLVDRLNRNIKRASNKLQSPWHSNLSDGINGKTVIRSMHASEFMEHQFREHTNNWSRQAFFTMSLTNWSMIVSYGFSFTISLACGIYLVYAPGIDSAVAALALTYANLIPYYQLHHAFIVSLLQVGFASLERLLDFSGEGGIVDQETAWFLDTDPLKEEWPSRGQVCFHHASLVYRPGLPRAVDDISLEIPAGEKVLVVGRTGSGKSSLINLLFRIKECTEGSISIDGKDISSVGLHTLRSSFGVVPQQPFLMAGSIRENLDPFQEYKDEQLLDVLLAVGLHASVSSLRLLATERDQAMALLDFQIGHAKSDTSVLSSGQQQLLSIARMLLKKVKVLVLGMYLGI